MMRSRIVFLTIAVIVLALSSCSKPKDLYDPDAVAKRDALAAQEAVDKNVERVFGVSFDADQSWESTTKGVIVISVDADLDNIVKVQILTESPFNNENARVLAESAARRGQYVRLTYDVPKSYEHLYACCVNDEGIYYLKGFDVGAPTVSFEKPAASRASRASSLPALDKLVLKRSFETFNSIRTRQANNGYTGKGIERWKDSGWDDDRYWLLENASVEELLIQSATEFDADEKKDLEDIFEKYLGAPGKSDNLQSIKNSDIFRLDNNYLTADGEHVVTVTPIAMKSGESRHGCHLYYYYYNPEVTAGMTADEEARYIKGLPKFKAHECFRTGRFESTENAKYQPKLFTGKEFFRYHTMLLPYYGDGQPVLGQTKAVSLVIPRGYKVGFMQHMINAGNGYSDNVKENIFTQVKNGDAYGDGRLNDEINYFGHFASAKLQAGDPRQAVFGLNGKVYITFEDGTDTNFNDMILEVGGVEAIDEPQSVESNVYSYCFEDREIGDYDMNDVIIKAQRMDLTHVKYTLAVCGGTDLIYLRNINGQVLNDHTEIHALFGVPTSQTVNTEINRDYVSPVEEIVTVSPSFSFSDPASQPYIYNATTQHEVRIVQSGTDPHALMLPSDFLYPIEKVCIKDAYPLFIDWGLDSSTNIDWYDHPDTGKVYIKK